MKFLRIALFFWVMAPLYLSGADVISDGNGKDVQQESVQSTEPSKEQLFRKPKENEPVFPLEDLIAKPLKDNDRLFADLINMMATLGLIIGLILIVAWFLKRLVNTRIEQMNENSMVRIVERRALSPKSMLYIIEVDDLRIILAETSQGITRIADYPAVENE